MLRTNLGLYSLLKKINIPTRYSLGKSSVSITLFTGLVITSYYYFKIHDKKELSREYFTKYKIIYHEDINHQHYMLELKPLISQKTNLWASLGSEKLWSVEIKQPDIMVVRKYTPLPLKHIKNNGFEVLKDGDNAQGNLVFYIKKYEQGEVSRWLHNLPEDSIVELRGPFIEYEFPHLPNEITRDRSFLWGEAKRSDNFKYQPFDLSMFTAGTGIVTALQLMLTESPFRGKIQLFHSCKNQHELGPLKPLLHSLQDHDRIDLYLFESDKDSSFKTHLEQIETHILKPSPYLGKIPFIGIDNRIKPIFSLVCGPDKYITSISGTRYDLEQGQIEGLLGKKGWTNENVYKLS